MFEQSSKKDRFRQSLLNQIEKEFNLSKENFCVVGSFPLDVLGVKDIKNVDLYIESTNVKNKSYNLYTKIIMGTKVEGMGEHRGFVSFLKEVNISDKELIYNNIYYFIYYGYKIVRPELYYAEKLYRCTKISHIRPKDFKVISLMKKCFINNKHDKYIWNNDLVIYPRNRRDKVKMYITHTLFKLLFKIPLINHNWAQVSKFFWCLEYKGIRETMKITLDWYTKKNV